MLNSKQTSNDIQLLSIKNGKYFVKIKNLDIPISLNEYLYKKWIHEFEDESNAS